MAPGRNRFVLWALVFSLLVVVPQIPDNTLALSSGWTNLKAEMYTFFPGVKGIEEVQMRADAFTAFAVTFQGTGTSYDGSTYTVTGAQYYAPVAKQWMKSSFTVQGTNWRRQYSEELISY